MSTLTIAAPRLAAATETAGNKPQAVWRVAPAKKPLLSRVFGRREPTTYQRCLAVHLYFAGPRGGLS